VQTIFFISCQHTPCKQRTNITNWNPQNRTRFKRACLWQSLTCSLSFSAETANWKIAEIFAVCTKSISSTWCLRGVVAKWMRIVITELSSNVRTQPYATEDNGRAGVTMDAEVGYACRRIAILFVAFLMRVALETSLIGQQAPCNYISLASRPIFNNWPEPRACGQH
jgi:hypothetical protein